VVFGACSASCFGWKVKVKGFGPVSYVGFRLGIFFAVSGDCSASCFGLKVKVKAVGL